MDIKAFQSAAAGRLVRSIEGHWTFVPHPLPPTIEWTPDLVRALSQADRAMGRLSGMGGIFPNPHLLIHPFQQREAVFSSRIEGTQASLADLYNYQHSEDAATRSPEDTGEVANYVSALQYGIEMMREGNLITLNLLRKLHAVLLADARGQWRSPGKFRNQIVHIGPPHSHIEEATFVPPAQNEMLEALNLWEQYLHNTSNLPPLIRLGLIHYQFEAIHPFFDGNGRIGRLLLILLLMSWDLLPQPLLYLSAYFEHYRKDYYDLLLAVSQSGAWESWLVYFLCGVTYQSQDALQRGLALLSLYEHYRQRYQTFGKIQGMVELIFENPYHITAKIVAQELSISSPTAYHYLTTLVEDSILQQRSDRQKGRVYVAEAVKRIIEAPLSEVAT